MATPTYLASAITNPDGTVDFIILEQTGEYELTIICTMTVMRSVAAQVIAALAGKGSLSLPVVVADSADLANQLIRRGICAETELTTLN